MELNQEIYIEAFRINKLFGALDHNVGLRGGVTFIHGPNGCGKTTTLLVVESIIKNRFFELLKINFESAELDLSDRTTLVVERIVKEQPDQQAELSLSESISSNGDQEQIDIRVSLRRGKSIVEKRSTVIKPESLEEVRNKFIQRPSLVEREFPFLNRTGVRSWRNVETGENYSLSEIIETYAESLAINLPDWYLGVTRKIKIGVVRTQRLFDFRSIGESENKVAVKELVNTLSNDVMAKINYKLAESAIKFQRKEKTFPHRILAGSVKAESEGDLREAYIKLQSRIADLESVGLQESSDSLILPQVKLNPTHKRVLTLYLADVNEKLDVFNDLYTKIQLLTNLVSTKFRRKIFSINRNEGFSIVQSDGAKSRLKPDDLSSGEKHQLVMLYELIFSDNDGQLYLIDEPEISLHVEWQRQFLDDLQRIAEVRGHRFIIATHSPQIINGRRDLAVGLDGGLSV